MGDFFQDLLPKLFADLSQGLAFGGCDLFILIAALENFKYGHSELKGGLGNSIRAFFETSQALIK